MLRISTKTEKKSLLLGLLISFFSKKYLFLSFPFFEDLRRHTIIGGYIVSLPLKLFFFLTHFLNEFMSKVANPHQYFPWFSHSLWAKQLDSDINDQGPCWLPCKILTFYCYSSSTRKCRKEALLYKIWRYSIEVHSDDIATS